MLLTREENVGVTIKNYILIGIVKHIGTTREFDKFYLKFKGSFFGQMLEHDDFFISTFFDNFCL